MIRKVVTFLVLAPLAAIIVMFAIANREAVTVVFDPFNPAQPAYAMKLPLFVLLLLAMILGVLVGGVAAWLRQSKWRRAARRLEGDIQALRREVETLHARVDGTAARRSEPMPLPYRPPAA